MKQINDLSAGPAPCDGCEHRAICADRLVACAAFRQYVTDHLGQWDDRKRREPNREKYRSVFRDGVTP